jgi:gluconolactonase
MDPRNLTTQVVLNNYFGHRFNSPNDVVISSKGIAYFTDGYYGHDNFNDTIKPQLANGVWRWDMNTGNIKQVTGYVAGLFYNPNGVAFNNKETVLYVTNRGNTSDDPWGGRSIYHFDVTDSGIKNGEVFAYTDSGFPDGVKTCKKGYVYGGVTGSVDVFDQHGTLVGKIKTDADDVAVNMQWVNDWLYIVARNFVYRVQLNSGNPQSY